MARYHINPVTGVTGKCSAVRGDCPFGGADSHFASQQEALEAFEEVMASMTLPPPTARQVALETEGERLRQLTLPPTTVLMVEGQVGVQKELGEKFAAGEYLASYEDIQSGEIMSATLTIDEAGRTSALRTPDPEIEAVRTLSKAALVEAVLESQKLEKESQASIDFKAQTDAVWEKAAEVRSYGEFLEEQAMGLTDVTAREAVIQAAKQLGHLGDFTQWETINDCRKTLAAVQDVADNLDHLGVLAVREGEDPTPYWSAAGGLEPLLEGTMEIFQEEQ